jgi:hypothetical protein
MAYSSMAIIAAVATLNIDTLPFNQGPGKPNAGL